MARDNLERRGHKYYLRLAIPRSLRKHFLSSKGKPRAHVVEPLGDSHELAKIKAAERTAVLMRVYAAVRAGQLTTPEQVKAAVRDEIADEPLITSEQADELIRNYRERHRILQMAARFEAWSDAAKIITACNLPSAQHTTAPSSDDTRDHALN